MWSPGGESQMFNGIALAADREEITFVHHQLVKRIAVRFHSFFARRDSITLT